MQEKFIYKKFIDLVGVLGYIGIVLKKQVLQMSVTATKTPVNYFCDKKVKPLEFLKELDTYRLYYIWVPTVGYTRVERDSIEHCLIRTVRKEIALKLNKLDRTSACYLDFN